MSKLKLSVAIGNYDRARPLFDGTVQIDGVDPVFMQLPPEEIFFRAFRTRDFDICELSMSSFAVLTVKLDIDSSQMSKSRVRKARKKISSGGSCMNTGSTPSIWTVPSNRGRARS